MTTQEAIKKIKICTTQKVKSTKEHQQIGRLLEKAADPKMDYLRTRFQEISEGAIQLGAPAEMLKPLF